MNDDVDELSLALDSLVHELAMRSASNFVALSKLTSATGLELNLQSLRSQRHALENASIKISDFFTKTDEDIRNAIAETSLLKQQQRAAEAAAAATLSESMRVAAELESKKKQKKQKKKNQKKRRSIADAVSLVDTSTVVPPLFPTVNTVNEDEPSVHMNELGSDEVTIPGAVLDLKSAIFQHAKHTHHPLGSRKDSDRDRDRDRPEDREGDRGGEAGVQHGPGLPLCASSLSHSLREGDLVELCGRSCPGRGPAGVPPAVWSLGTVVGVRRDSRGALRLVQVGLHLAAVST